MANPQPTWAFLNSAKGSLRLFSDRRPDSTNSLWDCGNVLLQKFPAEQFQVTTRLTFTPHAKLEEEAGLAIMGLSYASLGLKKKGAELYLVYKVATTTAKPNPEEELAAVKMVDSTVFLRVEVTKGAVCHFSFSLDGKAFKPIGSAFTAQPGRWKGAKVGLYCTRQSVTNDAGYADFDWFRVEPLHP